MASTFELLTSAFQQHQIGHFTEAEQLCHQILTIDPNQIEALHLFGVIAIQTDRYELAADLITWAIALNPNDFVFHVNLGSALRAQGKLDEAIACFQKALELKADCAEAYNNLGAAFEVRGEQDRAVSCYQQAIRLRPDFGEAYNNLGNTLLLMERVDEAADCFKRSLELNPNHAEAYSNLANALLSQGNTEEPLTLCKRALELKPDFPEAFNNLGNALQSQGKHDEAVACYRSALATKPNFAEVYTNLGTSLTAQGKLDEAINVLTHALELKPDYALTMRSMGNVLQAKGMLNEAVAYYRKALELKPNFAEVYFHMGNTLKEQGRLAEALDSYGDAVALSPDYADARANRSLLLLQHGDFERGWTEYEWRWKTKKLVERQFIQPAWDGSPLRMRMILLHAEQGFGDSFQFVRYTTLIKESNPAATIVVECQRPLVKLLTSCPSIDRLIAEGDARPPLDVQSPFLSLPRVFQTTSKTIPANVPYLFADAKLISWWGEKMAAVKGLRIGINWRGREGNIESHRRDIPLELFAALAQIPGVKLVSLQKGSARAELSAVGAGVFDPGEDFDTSHGGFMDSAAMMMNLDLVITSDTSVPHLAGALGLPVWVALPYVPDWRWLLDRSDSPWYPTMRLFRQKRAGDWAGVFEEIGAALRERRT